MNTEDPARTARYFSETIPDPAVRVAFPRPARRVEIPARVSLPAIVAAAPSWAKVRIASATTAHELSTIDWPPQWADAVEAAVKAATIERDAL